MVERIDRPDTPPPPYQITRPKESREKRHEQQQSQEEKEKRYRTEEGEKEWKKFGRRTVVVKPIRVQRERIARCLFRGINLRSGMGILQIDVVWKGGKSTRGALILIRSLENFMHLKKFKPGQEVPENFWAIGPTVEIGIPQVITTEAAFPERESASLTKGREEAMPPERSLPRWLVAVGLADEQSGRINWGIAALYLFLIAAIVAVIVL